MSLGLLKKSRDVYGLPYCLLWFWVERKKITQESGGNFLAKTEKKLVRSYLLMAVGGAVFALSITTLFLLGGPKVVDQQSLPVGWVNFLAMLLGGSSLVVGFIVFFDVLFSGDESGFQTDLDRFMEFTRTGIIMLSQMGNNELRELVEKTLNESAYQVKTEERLMDAYLREDPEYLIHRLKKIQLQDKFASDFVFFESRFGLIKGDPIKFLADNNLGKGISVTAKPVDPPPKTMSAVTGDEKDDRKIRSLIERADE